MRFPRKFGPCIVAIAAAAHLCAPAARARSCRVSLIPNSQALINKGLVAPDGCNICHTNGGGTPRNAFGRDVQAAVSGSASCLIQFWGPALAALDSDGDGRTNGEELQDPLGLWTPGAPQPGDPARATLPGDASSFIPPPPAIVLQPRSQSARAGQSVSFSVQAAGAGPIQYRWFFGATDLAQTSPTLSLSLVGPPDAGLYRCDVSNIGGTTASDFASLAALGADEPDASIFLGHTLPSTLAPGQLVVAGFAWRDASNLSWSAPQGYAMAVVADPDGLLQGAPPFAMPEGLVVPPLVGVCQFAVAVRAPESPGIHSFQIQMLDPPDGAFGPIATIQVSVAAPANAAADWAAYE